MYDCRLVLAKEERDEARRLLDSMTRERDDLIRARGTLIKTLEATSHERDHWRSARQSAIAAGDMLKADLEKSVLQNGRLSEILNDIRGMAWRTVNTGRPLDPGSIINRIERDGVATCAHEWKDARNKIVESGEICLKCNSIRAGNESTDNRDESSESPECGNCGGDLVQKTEPAWICPKCEL